MPQLRGNCSAAHDWQHGWHYTAAQAGLLVAGAGLPMCAPGARPDSAAGRLGSGGSAAGRVAPAPAPEATLLAAPPAAAQPLAVLWAAIQLAAVLALLAAFLAPIHLIVTGQHRRRSRRSGVWFDLLAACALPVAALARALRAAVADLAAWATRPRRKTSPAGRGKEQKAKRQQERQRQRQQQQQQQRQPQATKKGGRKQ